MRWTECCHSDIVGICQYQYTLSCVADHKWNILILDHFQSSGNGFFLLGTRLKSIEPFRWIVWIARPSVGQQCSLSVSLLSAFDSCSFIFSFCFWRHSHLFKFLSPSPLDSSATQSTLAQSHIHTLLHNDRMLLLLFLWLCSWSNQKRDCSSHGGRKRDQSPVAEKVVRRQTFKTELPFSCPMQHCCIISPTATVWSLVVFFC